MLHVCLHRSTTKLGPTYELYNFVFLGLVSGHGTFVIPCGNPRMSVVCLSAWNSSRNTPDQGTTIAMDLWTNPDRLVMTEDRLATCAWPSRVLTSDGEQDKTDLRPTCDCIHSFHEFAAVLGPDRIHIGVSSEESSVWSLPGTCDPMSILCHSYVDHMSLISHSRFTLEARMSLLCHLARIATLDTFQEWLATDLRPCSDIWVLEWHTTNLWGTYTRHRSQPRVDHSGKVFRPF